MRPWILALCLICSASLLTSAQDFQSRRPTLTGSIISVTPKINPNGAKPLFVYDVRLNLLLRNDTAERLIVIRPSLDLLSRRIEFVDGYGDSLKQSPWDAPFTTRIEDMQRRAAAVGVRAASHENPAKSYEIFARSLDSRNPTQANLLKMEPGTFYEFSEIFTIEDGYKLEIHPGQSLVEVGTNTPIAVFPALRVEFRLSLKNYHPNDGLLRVLRDRWRPQGLLVLDDGGDFWMRSEIMFNREGT